MRRRWLPLSVVVVAALAGGCGGGDGDDPPSAVLEDAPTTERTTTTLSVEAEVEAAYLRSWEVYAEAVLELDYSKLDRAFDGPALKAVREDVAELITKNQRGRMALKHDYSITVRDDVAEVVDRQVNHSVALDADTWEPVESDPNERLTYIYLLQLIEGQWKVIDISSA